MKFDVSDLMTIDVKDSEVEFLDNLDREIKSKKAIKKIENLLNSAHVERVTITENPITERQCLHVEYIHPLNQYRTVQHMLTYDEDCIDISMEEY